MASSSHLKPGENGRIVARIAARTQGLVVETIDVRSNDPKRPKVLLTLQAEVTETIPLLMPQEIRR